MYNQSKCSRLLLERLEYLCFQYLTAFVKLWQNWYKIDKINLTEFVYTKLQSMLINVRNFILQLKEARLGKQDRGHY